MLKEDKEKIIKLIKEKYKELDRIPRKRDMENYNQIIYLFGSWSKALIAADIVPRYATKFKKEEIKKFIINWANENGRSPTKKDIAKAKKDGVLIPHPKNLELLCGCTWNELLKDCGLEIVSVYRVNKYISMSDDEILQLIKEGLDRSGEHTIAKYMKYKTSKSPCMNYICKRFGSWTRVLQLLNYNDK